MVKTAKNIAARGPHILCILFILFILEGCKSAKNRRVPILCTLASFSLVIEKALKIISYKIYKNYQ